MDITLAETLLNQLYQSVNLLHRSRSEDGPERGRHTNRGQGRLLALLLRQDGLSHKEIVQQLDIRPSSAGELVAKLEQAGYVVRSNNKKDKRVCNIYLTEEGREVAQRGTSDHAKGLEKLFSGLTEEEMRQFSDLMGKWINSIKGTEQECRHHHRHHDHHHAGRRRGELE